MGTPLNDAIRHRDLWMMHWILFRGGSVNPGGFTPLREALNTGDPRVVRLLLQRGARADDEEFDGSTPLMNAASYPDRRTATIMCRLLLQYGARRAPRIRLAPVDGYAGKTASDLAAAQGHRALAEELRPLPGRR